VAHPGTGDRCKGDLGGEGAENIEVIDKLTTTVSNTLIQIVQALEMRREI
jgi:hypothetical protein